jgi:epoxyqueuosine reductase
MLGIQEITSLVKRAALETGFELAGVAPVRDFDELAYFPQWIADGHAGEMKYLEARDEAGRLKRESLRTAAPWARSVIVCAINYNTAQPYSRQGSDPGRGWISRYAWGREDYHDVVLKKLREVEKRLAEAIAAAEQEGNFGESMRSEPTHADHCETDGLRSPVRRARTPVAPPPDTQKRDSPSALRTWCYVDTGPIVERVYAKYAGVGWIGKNTCVLNQKLGSWLFLGVILSSLELVADLPAADRCGTCTRCLDACPTHAFVGPYQLDANKCISYLTIEKRGGIPEELRDGIGRHVFGCDICQDVCPWNRKAPATWAPQFQARERLVNPALEWLAEIKAEDFRTTFRGSPMRRAKLSGVRRNAVIAMGNSGNREFVPTLEKLGEDEDPVVAESAAWALRKLEDS